MTAIILIVFLLVGALVQSLVPAAAGLGLSKPPVLLAVALYFALVHSRGVAVTAAILAGILQDSMSLFPVGTSSLCFVVFSLLIVEWRESLVRESLLTVAILGAGTAALTTLALALMLSLDAPGAVIPPWWVALKMGGNALLGLATAPLVWWLASGLEHHVGLTEDNAR